jgi:spore coat polysaccharide biosynthesis protein SpsF
MMIKTFQNIVTVIQARMSSTRLPGKVMLKVMNRPVLSLMVERVQKSRLAGTIVVATSVNSEDDIIAEMCKRENIICFRGHATDLLERHYRAALEYDADVIIKIPSDCPLIDPEIIDRIVELFIKHQSNYDYLSNLHPASYPDGNDVEVFSFKMLYKAYKEAGKDFEREHTTPFMWNNDKRFNIGNVEWETGFNYSLSHRFVLDYMEDYEFIKTIYEILYPSNPEFRIDDILRLLELKPEVKAINRHLRGINWYKDHLSEIKINQFKPVSIAV